MSEQIEQASGPSGVQCHRKGRTKEEKIGRLKYTLQLLKDVKKEIHELREMQRVILNGLKGAGYFHFDTPLIQKLACVDQVDLEILQRVFETGRGGIFPKDVAAALPEYHLHHWHVSRRIVRMNKRLRLETGEDLFEKRGHKWALTSFGFETWGNDEKPRFDVDLPA